MSFLFNDTATTEIYTLSRHDALPISMPGELQPEGRRLGVDAVAAPDGRRIFVLDSAPLQRIEQPVEIVEQDVGGLLDRKSTRLNSSHANISYAVFCLQKKESPCSGSC